MCNYCNQPVCNCNRPYYNPPYTQPCPTPYSVPFNRDCIPPVPPPLCRPACKCTKCTQIGCLVTIGSDCVTNSCPLPCLQIGTGTKLSTILLAIDTKLCALSPPLVCPSWVELTKANLGLSVKYAWDGASQKPAISTPDNCGVVTLVGTITGTSVSSINVGDNIQIGVLPVGSRPKQTRHFSVNLITTLFSGFAVASILTIESTGNYYFRSPYNASPYNVGFALDGISFNVNTIIT